jgi:hypothetical protein
LKFFAPFLPLAVKAELKSPNALLVKRVTTFVHSQFLPIAGLQLTAGLNVRAFAVLMMTEKLSTDDSTLAAFEHRIHSKFDILIQNSVPLSVQASLVRILI